MTGQTGYDLTYSAVFGKYNLNTPDDAGNEKCPG